MKKDIDKIHETLPFISGIKSCNVEYVGIIQNCDEKILSFYDLNAIKTEDEKKLLLELADIWWWQSNRKIPLNIFLSGQLKSFRYCLRTFNMKDIEVLFGPVTSLNNILKKRIKRRQIQLVKKNKE